MTNGPGKSDRPVVPEKSPNKGRATGPRRGRRERVWPKGTCHSKTRPGHRAGKTRRARWSGYVKQQERIRSCGSQRLLHHIYNLETLRIGLLQFEEGSRSRCGRGRRGGTNGETLEANLLRSSERLKRGGYRAKPVRRVYIPKGRRAAKTARSHSAGRQNRPACGGRGALNAYLRNRLSWVFVRVPARAKPASSAGRAVHGTVDEKSELGA